MRWTGALLVAIGLLLGYVAGESMEVTEDEKEAAGLLEYYRDTVLGFQAYESGDMNYAVRMRDPELREDVVKHLRRWVGSESQEMKFEAEPDQKFSAAWRDPASGRHFQFLGVSLGNITPTAAEVVMSWHYAPMAGGITVVTLEKGWRGWKVTKRESKATI